MPLIPDPRSQLAKNFREGMDLTDIMPGGMGMAAKMSSPAVDVLSRWIRRFRKDKPPTVPLKHIEKAVWNEGVRRGTPRFDLKGQPLYGATSIDDMAESIKASRPRRPYRVTPGNLLTDDQARNLGFQEREEFDKLRDFIKGLRFPRWGDK